MDLLLTRMAADDHGARVKAVAPDSRFLVVEPDGTLTGPDGPVPVEEARPDVAWGTADLFDDGAPIRRFFGIVRHSSTLRWFQSPAAGIDQPVFAELVQRGVRLTTSHVNSIGIAEYVIRAVLDHFQRAGEWRAAQTAHEWRHHEFREAAGTTWLVVGLGSIGSAVATRAKALDARIVGVRRHPDGSEPADEVHTPDALLSLLPDADVVVLSAPATPDTTALADEKFFAAMKPGSILVNVGRGALVDEDALRVALDRGTPDLAALDVAVTEPVPADSWLWSHPRVALTPHNSAAGDGRFGRAADLFCDNLGRYLAGEPLRNEVAMSDVS
jgi:phosphoglycerate dehydrogenase-like enzyme